MQAHLEYESLEKLHVPRPVDRLDYIAGCCVGRTVLDIGCFDETALEKRGTEHWLHGRILEKAVQVTGIDISDKLPEQGLETGANGRILRRDAALVELHGIDADAIEVIVAGEFIEHLEHPLQFFRELKRTLPGREFVLSTPNGVCFANTLMGTIGREVQHPDHLHNFTYKTLNTMCLRAGFQAWEIVPYRFYATEMILASSGARRWFVRLVQGCIRMVERCFPLLSFGYVVRGRI